MNYESMPKIRLEVEHMKYQILHYLGANGSELGDRLSSEIMRSVESYPWQSEVNKIVHEAISSHVSDYFKWGEGREMIKEVMNEAFKEAFRDASN